MWTREFESQAYGGYVHHERLHLIDEEEGFDGDGKDRLHK